MSNLVRWPAIILYSLHVRGFSGRKCHSSLSISTWPCLSWLAAHLVLASIGHSHHASLGVCAVLKQDHRGCLLAVTCAVSAESARQWTMLQSRFQAHRTVRASPLVYLRSAENLGNPVSPTGGDIISNAWMCTFTLSHTVSLSLTHSLSFSLTHSHTNTYVYTYIHTYINTYRHTYIIHTCVYTCISVYKYTQLLPVAINGRLQHKLVAANPKRSAVWCLGRVVGSYS